MPTELTTAATGALLGVVVVGGIRYLRKQVSPSFALAVWTAALTAFASAAVLGLIVHGLDLSPGWNTLLWQPLYLMLGVALALFTVGAVHDRWGEASARRWLPWALAAALCFYLMTIIQHGDYLVFVLFEGAALIWATGSYLGLARQKRPGAAMVASGLLASILAGGLQATTLGVTVIWAFDHNSLYHLAQLAGVLALIRGLRDSLDATD